MPEAIIPTRIIPAGTPVPARASVPPPRQPPPPVRPAPPAEPPHQPGQPLVVRHVHVHEIFVRPAADPVPVPPARPWFGGRVRPVITALAAALAFGHLPEHLSLTADWAGFLYQCRTQNGLAAAYVLAATGLTGGAVFEYTAGPRSGRIRQLAARTLLLTTVIGGTGALGWYDLVTLITGVHP